MGEQFRDYIYVDDLVEAIILLLNDHKTGIGEIINISYGKSYLIKDIATQFANMIKKNGEKMLKIGSLGYRKSEVMNYHASNRKAKLMLNWYPKTSLKAGLRKIASSLI